MSRAENLQDMRAVRTAHRPTSAASITDTSLLAHLGKTIATVIRCYRIVTRLSLQDLADRVCGRDRWLRTLSSAGGACLCPNIDIAPALNITPEQLLTKVLQWSRVQEW
jgi:hypothetical protein